MKEFISFDRPCDNTCIYYGRDRGFLNEDTRVFSRLKKYLKSNRLQDKDYVFNGKNVQWYVLNKETYKLQRLDSLLLNNEYVRPQVKDIILAQKISISLERNVPNKDLVQTKKKKI